MQLQVGDRAGRRRRARARPPTRSSPLCEPHGGRAGRRGDDARRTGASTSRDRVALARDRPASASTDGRPISAFSASGVPSATMCPWSMIPTRSASTSASSRYCVVRKTVTPSSRASRATSAHRSARLEGSRPVVGSSRNSTRGRVHEREREVEPALHAARVAADLAIGGVGRGPTRSSSSSPRARRSALRQALERRLQPHVVAPGEQRVERRLLQRGADRRAHRGALAHDVVARHARRARGRRQQRGEHQHGRRLARAVRARGSRRSPRAATLQLDAVDGARAVLELADETLDLDAVAHPRNYAGSRTRTEAPNGSRRSRALRRGRREPRRPGPAACCVSASTARRAWSS